MQLVSETADAGKRLDHFLAARLAEYSRSRLQSWIKQGRVTVDGAAAKASTLLHGGERIVVEPAALPPLDAAPENLPLDIVYEDDEILVINKPAGMVVHAGAGVASGTLTNALVAHFGKTLSSLGGPLRPGIVHRIDRATSGLLVVARTDSAHRRLARQFASREVEKVYLALASRVIRADAGRIERPIARDPVRRTRMTTRLDSGRAAYTEFRVLRRFAACTYLEVRIGTGRTHQIRVHLASIGHPIVGDRLYGGPSWELEDRIFLHAHRIRFAHPFTGETVAFEAPLPADLESWLGRVGRQSI